MGRLAGHLKPIAVALAVMSLSDYPRVYRPHGSASFKQLREYHHLLYLVYGLFILIIASISRFEQMTVACSRPCLCRCCYRLPAGARFNSIHQIKKKCY